VGVTATTIKIAVIADVDNAISPGIFQSPVNGVNAAAKVINRSGGVAGRKLQVDFIDSKLNPNETRNAIITACQQDFAMVGTSALFVTNVDDMVNCPDAKGAATGQPDFGAIVASAVEACAPVSWPVLPTSVPDCSTATQNPVTYYTNTGPAKWFLKKTPGLHGAFVLGNDTKASLAAGTALADGYSLGGIKADQTTPISGRSPQSAYTPIVSQMKQDNSNFGYNASTAAAGIALRSEAALQGITSGVTWACNSSCYNKQYTDAGSAVDGTYVALPQIPLEDAKSYKPMKQFIAAVGADKADSFATYGYASAYAFKAAVEAAVKKAGNDNVTRADVIAGAKTITSFDGAGLVQPIDLAGKKGTSCFVMVQLNGGTWKRLNPTKPGTFSCPKNAIEPVKISS
jgi:ABC-type branched-subunit amino acid transport system substrate-binding protein